jgi:hypothetical protein
MYCAAHDKHGFLPIQIIEIAERTETHVIIENIETIAMTETIKFSNKMHKLIDLCAISLM